MYFIRKEFLTFNNNLYYIVKTVKEEDRPIIENLKEYLQADLVLKKEGKLYFLRNIPEAEIINNN
jgi:hypothetical protein